MAEYIVVTQKGIDVANLDYDLQRDTSLDDGVDNSVVPGRSVDVVDARPANNRMTHYDLTDEEASALSNDARVLIVEQKPDQDTIELFGTQTADFQRSSTNGADDVNWGTYRHTQYPYTYTSANSNSQDYNYTLDGTGVDLVVQDDGVQVDHPEWEDANGVSRFQQIDWYAVTGLSGTMPASHYLNTTADSNAAGAHGSHCAGIAAGKTYGWAKNAKIYSLRIFGGSGHAIGNDRYDLIRLFHEQKPVDPDTGFKRPTIVNQSWGYSWYYKNGQFGSSQIQTLFYRGVNQGVAAQAWTSGVFAQYGAVTSKHPMSYTVADVEQEQLTDSGVICVKAAGNSYHPCAGSDTGQKGDTIYNSYYTLPETWAGYITAGNPIFYNRPSSPHSLDTLWVANITQDQYGSEEYLRQDSERGARIDISAAGSQITSATSSASVYGTKQNYPPNTSYSIARISGTSMAAPQITGMGALWLQANPGGTAQELKEFLSLNAKDALYNSGNADSFNASNSIPRLYGAPNKIAYWPWNSPNPIKYKGTSGSGQG